MLKFFAGLLFMFSSLQVLAQTQVFEPVNFSRVTINDEFWKPKMDKVATKTLQACIYQTEVKTARIRNFEIVAGKRQGKFEGIFYDDSDVFKALEAIAYSLKNRPDSAMENKADRWIDLIAAAQQPDGYLNTYYTLLSPEKRWTDMSMHEDYNGGHMIEAAVAYYDATGKRKFLDVAIKWADHFDSLFGPGKRHWVTGHQELELALVKLYKTTGNTKYLKLADWLLSERGHRHAKGYTWTNWKDTGYAQDLVPVKQQKEITGHAVRAMYLYTGAADVAASTGDRDYMNAMKTVWEDVVYRNMYITGGIGSAGSNEGFSKDYDLPNELAYCETCAAVGMVFWNQRMNFLTGDGRYIDVLEKSLYNAALDGLSLTGDQFFYENPLASTGQHSRREWFGTACCPANIARLVASLGNYIYGESANGVYINLFIGSETNLRVGKSDVAVKMQTNYPLEGTVQVEVNPAKTSSFDLNIRIPGWVSKQPAPGELYFYEGAIDSSFQLLVNDEPVAYSEQNGYAVISRRWKKGDKVLLKLPMDVRRVRSRPELEFNKDRIALQRGPLVYCVEGADNNGKAWNFTVPSSTTFKEQAGSVLDEKIISISMDVPVISVDESNNSLSSTTRTIKAIPYYAWANRGKNEMQVWLPVRIKDVRINY